MFPHGDSTEVGEKASIIYKALCQQLKFLQGISLSGGQKQRLNICRALYCDADIQIFDDPLSALDAHVGKAVFHNVFQNALQGKTRVLVTHALHFLPQVDYIITMLDGRIVERGTYKELVENNGPFAKFMAEFGAKEEADQGGEEAPKEEKRKKAMVRGAIMQTEERNTGAVSNASR
jgi:ABC-type multidrug transport system ATPase subunit